MTSLRNKLMLFAVAVATSLMGLGAASASTSAFCDAQVAPYRGELDAKAAPALTELDNGIADIRKAGVNPDKIAVKTQDGSFKTLPQLRSLLLGPEGRGLEADRRWR